MRKRIEESLFPPRYCDPERVAQGGMGDVFRATDVQLERTVAIKFLAERYSADAELRQRFTREALAAARLSGGPSTVTIYDVGDWQSRPFIVMEYLAGASLAEVLRRDGPQSLERAVTWLAQAGAALDYAHAHGVVHRDVKPANLLLDLEGNVHVADFGIASAAGLASVTQTGTVLGTAGYLAPEQAAGKPATAAVDRYALAVVAFEMLTGERPFQGGDSPTAETVALATAPVPAISARNSRLPAVLDRVFDQALARDPDARFASCAEFVETIQAVTNGATETAPTRDAYAGPSRRRAFVRPAVLGLLLVALAGAGAVPAVILSSERGHAAGSVSTRATAGRGRTPTRAGQLNRRARLIQAAEFGPALPLLQQAVYRLRGTGTAAEAEADSNLAYALIRLGSCEGVLPLLDRASLIEGNRPEIDELRSLCSGPPGHRPGHGHGHGHGKRHDD